MEEKYAVLVDTDSGKYVIVLIGTIEECQEFEMNNHMDYPYMEIIEVLDLNK